MILKVVVQALTLSLIILLSSCEYDVTPIIENPVNNGPEYTGTIPDADDYYFSKEDSPHYINENITTTTDQRFIVEAGAVIYIGEGVEINCYDDILIEGTETDTVFLKPSVPSKGWAFLKAKKETDHFYITYASITDGILFSNNSINKYYNVEFHNTQDLTWESANARFWFGKVDIRDCKIFGINKAEGFLIHDAESPSVTNCYFYQTPDAVEMLNCNNGVISNNSFNNLADDAIDLNGCSNTVIENNYITYIADSGMEIGSENYGRTTGTILNSNIISHCKKGIWLKESSEFDKFGGSISDCTFGIELNTPNDSTKVSKAYLKGVLFSNNEQNVKIDTRSQITIED